MEHHADLRVGAVMPGIGLGIGQNRLERVGKEFTVQKIGIEADASQRDAVLTGSVDREYENVLIGRMFVSFRRWIGKGEVWLIAFHLHLTDALQKRLTFHVEPELYLVLQLRAFGM